jgi:hypothetical protein
LGWVEAIFDDDGNRMYEKMALFTMPDELEDGSYYL